MSEIWLVVSIVATVGLPALGCWAVSVLWRVDGLLAVVVGASMFASTMRALQDVLEYAP